MKPAESTLESRAWNATCNTGLGAVGVLSFQDVQAERRVLESDWADLPVR